MKQMKLRYGQPTNESLCVAVMFAYTIGSASLLGILILIQWLIQ